MKTTLFFLGYAAFCVAMALLAMRLAKDRILGKPCDAKPEPGQKWRFQTKADGPWPATKAYPPVTVLDVKDGWVRYDLCGDSRLRVRDFVRMYRPEST